MLKVIYRKKGSVIAKHHDTCNPNTMEAKSEGSASSKLVWSTWQVPGQPELHRGTISEKQNKHLQKKKKNGALIEHVQYDIFIEN